MTIRIGRAKAKKLVAAVVVVALAIGSSFSQSLVFPLDSILVSEEVAPPPPPPLPLPLPPVAKSLRQALESEEVGEDEDNDNEDDEDRYVAFHHWARDNLRPVSRAPEPSTDNFLFWHIPKSGGSTVKAFYQCLGKKIDVESRPKDILWAKEMSLVASGQVDIIFSSSPGFAVKNLYDPYHKGRAMALFRHPVDRLVSKFYYLQTAKWEKSYRPNWKDMDILDWAMGGNTDNDQMVKQLAGKPQIESVTDADLRAAKNTLRQKFVVGLVDEIGESTRRFNVVMGIDESRERSEGCTDRFFGERGAKTNSNPHPKVEQDSPAWQLLAEKNALDIQLYEYVVQLFEVQREIIGSYASSTSNVL